jgi:hypothetical protein
MGVRELTIAKLLALLTAFFIAIAGLIAGWIS